MIRELSFGRCADTHVIEQDAWANLRPDVTVITARIAPSSWNMEGDLTGWCASSGARPSSRENDHDDGSRPAACPQGRVRRIPLQIQH
jgi:hypothetical protein